MNLGEVLSVNSGNRLSTKIIIMVECILLVSSILFCSVSIYRSRVGIRKAIQQRMLDIANCTSGSIDGDVLGSLTAEEAQNAALATYYGILNHRNRINFAEYGLDLTEENNDDVFRVYRHIITGYDVGILVLNSATSYSTYYDQIAVNYRFSGYDYEKYYKELGLL